MPNLELYGVRDNKVQNQSGLNWGFSSGHVNPSDAYIALTKRFILNNINFSPLMEVLLLHIGTMTL